MFSRLREIRDQVKEELKHIPRGTDPQNELRMVYWIRRMHSLGKKAKSSQSKEEVLRNSIEIIKNNYQGFAPQYDTEFFKLY
jgi:hypothetical protein